MHHGVYLWKGRTERALGKVSEIIDVSASIGRPDLMTPRTEFE
jgi:hypothetical protein